jgi:hypothetical protein
MCRWSVLPGSVSSAGGRTLHTRPLSGSTSRVSTHVEARAKPWCLPSPHTRGSFTLSLRVQTIVSDAQGVVDMPVTKTVAQVELRLRFTSVLWKESLLVGTVGEMDLGAKLREVRRCRLNR